MEWFLSGYFSNGRNLYFQSFGYEFYGYSTKLTNQYGIFVFQYILNIQCKKKKNIIVFKIFNIILTARYKSAWN